MSLKKRLAFECGRTTELVLRGLSRETSSCIKNPTGHKCLFNKISTFPHFKRRDSSMLRRSQHKNAYTPQIDEWVFGSKITSYATHRGVKRQS